jgi:hypothetical protein
MLSSLIFTTRLNFLWIYYDLHGCLAVNSIWLATILAQGEFDDHI